MIFSEISTPKSNCSSKENVEELTNGNVLIEIYDSKQAGSNADVLLKVNMAGVEGKQADFFASKSTNSLGILSMSLGDVHENVSELSVEIREDKRSYKKLVRKHGKS